MAGTGYPKCVVGSFFCLEVWGVERDKEEILLPPKCLLLRGAREGQKQGPGTQGVARTRSVEPSLLPPGVCICRREPARGRGCTWALLEGIDTSYLLGHYIHE